ncbi:sulfotransferase 1C2-like [Glandiceps talaboti]
MANKLPAVKVERPFEPKGDYYYEGVRYPQVCPASTLDALKDFDVNEDDIWILGFPKAGNTWITEIVYSILSGGNTDSLDIDHVPIEHDKLAFDPVVEPHYVDFVDRPSPRIIRSHLPYQLLPMQIKEKKPKTIYICRNAKDTMASFWFFVNSNNMLVSVPDWTDWFDSFLHEDNIFGSWFDHVTGFWNQCNEENFLFITYESMQKVH